MPISPVPFSARVNKNVDEIETSQNTVPPGFGMHGKRNISLIKENTTIPLKREKISKSTRYVSC